MKQRLLDIPRYGSRPYAMPAAYYNEVRLGLLRMGSPLRFSLPGLRTLEMYLDKDVWACLDSGLNDFPVLAWLEFETSHREALHESVPCVLFTYHAHANVVLQQVLEKTQLILDQKLHGQDPAPEQTP